MVRMTSIAAALWRPRLPKRLSPHLVRQYSQISGEKKSPFSRYFDSWPSFTEIDPHEVKWVPVNGVPRLYMNRALSAGLRHRLPPSVVLEAHMSISGSLGKPKYLSEDLETDPMRAHYELGVNMAPLPGSSLWANQTYLEYEAWLNKIYDSLLYHVAAHIEFYPLLRPHVKDYEGRAARKDGLAQFAMSPTRREKDDKGDERINTNYTYFKSRMFRRTNPSMQGEPKIYDAEIDREMWAKHHAVRVHVPVFDTSGNEIPVAARQVNAGDVVAACVTIDGQLLQIESEGRPFLGISRKVNSVVLVHAKPLEAGAGASDKAAT